MRIETDIKYDFDDVLIKPKISTLKSRKDVDITRSFKFLYSDVIYKGFPCIVANMDYIGTFEMARVLSSFYTMVALHKHYSVDELIKFFRETKELFPTFYSMGINKNDIEKYNSVKKQVVIQYVNIDVANGHMQRLIDVVKRFRETNANVVLMVGNVVSGEMTEQLILAGADIIKVGIGGGSSCVTRKVAGVGIPQFSAILETADSAHGVGGLICADGGLRTPGDFSKSYSAGADFNMSGGMFAGHSECDGEFIYVDNVPTHMKFHGMSSEEAMTIHNGGMNEYRASEGKEVLVPYRGSVINTIKEIQGGVRSACTYTGSRSLKELSKRTTFVLVNRTHNTIFGE